MNNKVHKCVDCDKIFNDIIAFEIHNTNCIFYNYKKIHLLKNINNEYIKVIIQILSTISKYDITNYDFISTKQILSNIIFKSNNIIFQDIYNMISSLKIDYISYNDLMHKLSLYFSITNQELELLIICYKTCQKNKICLY
jgi:hypothetical protein